MLVHPEDYVPQLNRNHAIQAQNVQTGLSDSIDSLLVQFLDPPRSVASSKVIDLTPQAFAHPSPPPPPPPPLYSATQPVDDRGLSLESDPTAIVSASMVTSAIGSLAENDSLVSVQDAAQYISPELLGVQSFGSLQQLLRFFKSPFVVSFALHAALLCALSMVVANVDMDGEQAVQINCLVDESQLLDPIECFKVSPDIASSESAVDDASSSVETSQQYARQALTDLALLEVEPESLVDFETAGYANSVLTGFDGEFGQAVPEKAVNTHQAEFYGIQSTGDRFVFVIDSSRSMASGRRWIKAVRELWTSLEGLHEEQEFFLVCFDERTHLMLRQDPDELSMLQPTAENIKKVKRWTGSIGFGRKTMPKTALSYALSLKPDAIFVLSDGEFMDDSYWFLRAQNFEPVPDKAVDEGATQAVIPIHTVAIQSETGAEGLKKIADEHRGQFRFIP